MKSAEETDALSLAEEAQLAELEKEFDEGIVELTSGELIFEHGRYEGFSARVFRHFAEKARLAGYKVRTGSDSVLISRKS